MSENQKSFPYEDIVEMSRPEVFRRIQLSKEDRAAQFAPFAALTGHGDLMEETARLTDAQIELAPDALAELDMVLQQLNAIQEQHPAVTVTYFQPDERKSGGRYITVTQQLQSLDARKQILLLEDGRMIPFSRLYDLKLEEDQHQGKC